MKPPPPFRSDCRHFTGYRPCPYGGVCEGCPHYEPVAAEVLLINLDGLGDVLRNTSLLPALHRALPGARLSWLTRARALPLLEDQPGLDRALPLDCESLAELHGRRWDLLLNADKSRVAGGLARSIPAREKRGFAIDDHGAIVPLGPSALHLYRLGLDDHLKFRVNRRPAQALTAEALGLPYAGEPYRLRLRPEERRGPPRLVGFNTGSAPGYPHKRLALEVQEAAIRLLAPELGEPVLLLGGPEDAERNAELARRLGPLAEPTPVDRGIREGAAQLDRCEVVVTGDSFGLHLAVALEKHVVAWFGPTCPQEIELYGRGIKLLAPVDCAPCWRRSCDRRPSCDQLVPPEEIARAVLDALAARREGRWLDEVRGGDWWPRGEG